MKKEPLPPHRRRDQQHDLHEATGNGAETDAEEEEEEEGGRYGETLRGAKLEVILVGRDMLPRRKTRTSRNLPPNMFTCCCRKSIETSHTTTMGCT